MISISKASAILFISSLLLAQAQFDYFDIPIGGDVINPVNPNYTYPQVFYVNTVDAGIPYPGQFITGYLRVNASTQSRIFYSLYAKGGNTYANATVNISAPLVLWLQGGPGCPDLQYDAMGPFNALNNSEGIPVPVKNGLTWNENYHLLFVDSPIGVGYSVSGGDNPHSAWETALQLEYFLVEFFTLFPNLKESFYIMGESYGGKYVPALTTILIQNFSSHGIQVRGIGIGNGAYDRVVQPSAYPGYGFSAGLLTLKDYFKAIEIDQDLISNVTAGKTGRAKTLVNNLRNIVAKSGTDKTLWNMDNYRNFTSAKPSDYSPWLRLDYVMEALGADPNVIWSGCNDAANDNYVADQSQSYIGNVTFILSQQVYDLDVVIFNGEDAIICSHNGVEMIFATMNWTNLTNFENNVKKVWTDPQGNIIGTVQNYNRLSLVNVYDAGHRSPVDQPWAIYDLLNRLVSKGWSDLKPVPN